MKKLFNKIVLLFTSSILVACGNDSGFESVTLQAKISENKTGAETIVTSPSDPFTQYQVPYTISGNRHELNRIQNKIGTDLDALFSRSIQKVDTKITDANGNVTRTSPKFIELNIELNEPFLNELSATAELKEENGQLKSSGRLKSRKESAFDYEYDLTCLVDNCANHEVLLVKVQSIAVDDKPTTSSEERKSAGVLVTESHPRLKFQRQKGYEDKKYNDPTLESLIRSANNPDTTVRRKTVVVLEGRSYADVTVEKTNKSESPSNIETPAKNENEILFSFSTDLTETNLTAANIDKLFVKDQETESTQESKSNVKDESSTKNLKAALVGNNPNTGSILVDLKSEVVTQTKELVDTTETATTRNKINNGDEPAYRIKETPVSTETVRVLVVEPDSSSATEQEKQEEKTADLNPPRSFEISAGKSENKVFPIPPNLENYPETQSVVEQISALHSPSKGRVKHIIQKLMSGERSDKDQCGVTVRFNNKGRLQSFLNHTQYISPILTKMASRLDVIPKVMNLAFIESGFFNENHPDQYLQTYKIASGTGPAGPFQIAYTTAKYLNDSIGAPYKIKNNLNNKGKIAARDDDRNFIIPSAHLASTYMARLFSEAKDPALAAFAYNRGEGNRNEYQEKALNHLGLSEHEDRLTRFDVTLDEIMDYNMVKKSKNVCHSAYYAYTFIALHFITENPGAYGFTLEAIEEDKQKLLQNALMGESTQIPTRIADILPDKKEEVAQN